MLDTYAGALAGVSRCQEAIEFQSRAVEMLRRENNSEATRQEIQDRLKHYQAHCGGDPQRLP